MDNIREKWGNKVNDLIRDMELSELTRVPTKGQIVFMLDKMKSSRADFEVPEFLKQGNRAGDIVEMVVWYFVKNDKRIEERKNSAKEYVRKFLKEESDFSDEDLDTISQSFPPVRGIEDYIKFFDKYGFVFSVTMKNQYVNGARKFNAAYDKSGLRRLSYLYTRTIEDLVGIIGIKEFTDGLIRLKEKPFREMLDQIVGISPISISREAIEASLEILEEQMKESIRKDELDRRRDRMVLGIRDMLITEISEIDNFYRRICRNYDSLEGYLMEQLRGYQKP